MGDMADMAIEGYFLQDELHQEYADGRMDSQDAMDAGLIDEHGGSTYRPMFGRKKKPIVKTCSMCGKTGLRWMRKEGQWVLGDGTEIHDCPNYKWVSKIDEDVEWADDIEEYEDD